MCVLRRDYGKPGRSLHTIAAKLCRTKHEFGSKAGIEGCIGAPAQFRRGSSFFDKSVAYAAAHSATLARWIDDG